MRISEDAKTTDGTTEMKTLYDRRRFYTEVGPQESAADEDWFEEES